jgi:cyclopropane-fatty-acyl-phospholipid synthase
VFWEKPLDNAISKLKKNVTAPVRLVLWDGREIALSEKPRVTVRLKGLRAASALARPSLLTLAEAYIDGDVELEGDVGDAIRGAEAITRAIPRPLFQSQGPTNERHSRRDDREAIQHHYDVSNEFYGLWLDPRMVYSCGYFRHPDDTLEAAQLQKLDHICTKLRLAPGERFLDIGCGWGALILHAAEAYGVRATGITLSRNQHEHVTKAIAERGLEGRVEVRLQDYLELPEDELYDKIASVGMFEHVGIARFAAYFGKIAKVLKPGGFVLNHGITHNALHGASLGSGIGDFVDEYVFPGGELTHVHRVIEAMSAAGLETVDAEALREHYARTLWHWTERLEANTEAARREAGDERFRVWRIYMAGSAHAFSRGWLSLWQLLAGKPLPDGALPHPRTRRFMYP